MRTQKLFAIAAVSFLVMVGAISAQSDERLTGPTPAVDGILPGDTDNNGSLKAWIFFADKGLSPGKAYKRALADLRDRFSDRSVARRIKRVDRDEPFDFYDLPVYPAYVDSIRNMGIRIIHKSRWLNAVSVYINPDQVEKTASLPFVTEVRPVAVLTRTPPVRHDKITGPQKKTAIFRDIPDSVMARYGFSAVQIDQINVAVVHGLGFSGQGVLIAVFDGGFDTSHPVFKDLNLIGDTSFIPSIYDKPDQLVHGTATLSVIGGRRDSTMIGTAYGADYLLAATEIIDVEIRLEEDNWVAAAEWADIMGADIITSSLGYYDWYQPSDYDGNTAVTTIAADLAVSRGIAVFTSAGNEGTQGIGAPADGDSVIAVGAVGPDGQRAGFSSVGPTADGRIKPDIMAMGLDVFVASYPWTGDVYRYGSGTSFSCPLAAGAGAVLLEAFPDWSPIDLREALIESGDNYLSPNNFYGYGIIDAFKAGDFFGFNPFGHIFVAVGDSLEREISIYTRALPDSVEVVITAENLPGSAEFMDYGNGTSVLRYMGKESDLGRKEVRFTARIGIVEVAEEIYFTVSESSRITAGPNPFTDSLSIFFGDKAGTPREISIHTANGEKVWDDFSDIYNSGMRSVVWKGVNNSGARVAPGVYFVFVRTDRMAEKIKVFKK